MIFFVKRIDVEGGQRKEIRSDFAVLLVNLQLAFCLTDERFMNFGGLD